MAGVASETHFLTEEDFAAPERTLPSLLTALASQAACAGVEAALTATAGLTSVLAAEGEASEMHFLAEAALAAPFRGLPFLSTDLPSQPAETAEAAAAAEAAGLGKADEAELAGTAARTATADGAAMGFSAVAAVWAKTDPAHMAIARASVESLFMVGILESKPLADAGGCMINAGGVRVVDGAVSCGLKCLAFKRLRPFFASGERSSMKKNKRRVPLSRWTAWAARELMSRATLIARGVARIAALE